MLNKDAARRFQLLDVLRAPVLQGYFQDLTRPGGIYSTAIRPSAPDEYPNLTPKERMLKRKQDEIDRKTQALNQAAKAAHETKIMTAQRREEMMRRSGEIPKVIVSKTSQTKISQLNPMDLAGTSFSRADGTMVSEQDAFEDVPYNGTVDSLNYSKTGDLGYSTAGEFRHSKTRGLEFSRDSLELSRTNPHDDKVISSSGYYDIENEYEDDFESEEEEPQPYESQSMATTATNPLDSLEGKFIEKIQDQPLPLLHKLAQVLDLLHPFKARSRNCESAAL